VQPTMYRICIRGRLTERLGSALEGMRLAAGATEPCSVVKSATNHSFTDSSTGSVI
jgi:hypothetical protein